MSNLKRLREVKNLTQLQLSENSGVNIRTIQHYEQGSKDINKAQGVILYKLAEALECDIKSLLEL
jgi:transcriptional regulator with XRE-family HTH domain